MFLFKIPSLYLLNSSHVYNLSTLSPDVSLKLQVPSKIALMGISKKTPDSTA